MNRFALPLVFALAGCAPTLGSDPLLVAYDLANEVAASLDLAARQHEARLEADLARRFGLCRERYEGADAIPCLRVQAGLARHEAMGEAVMLDHLTALHRDALGKLREARSCREAAQRCEGPAREAADALLARIRGDLRSLEARHATDTSARGEGVAQ